MPRGSTPACSCIPAHWTTVELERAESCFEPVRGEADVKAQKVSVYVAVALAYAYACGGAPSPFSSLSSTQDAGVAESGGGDDGGDDGGDLERKGDARAGDGGRDASGRSNGGAEAGAGDAANAGPSSNSSQYCCVSGAYYGCPTAAALTQCMGFDVPSCLARCASSDTACVNACNQKAGTGDPSGCTHDPTYDSTCTAVDAGLNTNTMSSSTSSTSNVQPPTPVRNSCGGLYPGTLACGTGGTCITGHCSGGACYPNDVGNPCTYGNDCGQGNHCTNGCCASPAKGSACTAFWDCKSNTCTSGICQ